MSESAQLQVNPAEEIIRLGPLMVRFLVTAAQSSRSTAVFELFIPGGERLRTPAHSHDHYE
ncbi:MAG: hypothetical protein ACRD1F_02200, partial [Terriglobales bacterium]